MKLMATTRLRAGELQVEREGIGLNTRPVGRIEKSGTQHCVRSSNPNDPNFGCWPSKEEAQEHVRELDAVSQYGRTGWPFGRGIAHQVGYISRRETTGYQTGGRGRGARMATPKGPTHKPNPSVGRGTAIGVKRPAVSLRRPKLESYAKPAKVFPVKQITKADLKHPAIRIRQKRLDSFADYGEPMAGAMGHAHIDPVTWFHPPSLTKRVPNEETRVPGDDPRETNDKFGDVTKRKEAYEQRMKLLKRSGPSGAVPVRTTLLAPHSGVYQPLYSSALKAKRMKGRGRMFTSYERRGVL